MRNVLKRVANTLVRTGKQRKNKAIAELIRDHFDADYYLNCNPDVREAGLDPVMHYVQFGASEGRNPTRQFDTNTYQTRNTSQTNTGRNPFLDYLISAGLVEAGSTGTQGNKAGRKAQVGRADASMAPPLANAGAGPAVQQAELSAGLAKSRQISSLLDLSARTELSDHLAAELTGLRLREAQEIAGGLELSATDRTEIRSDAPDRAFVGHVLGLAKGKTLSLDIWDTALRRDCHPDETKLRAARAIYLNHVFAAGPAGSMHPVDIMKVRQLVESSLANESFEYRFGDVARLWGPLLGLGSEEQVAAIIGQEIAIEQAATRADPTVKALLDAFDGRSIAISDFYLDAAALKALLETSGVRITGPVYASSDHLKSKRAGDLFDLVLDQEGIAADQLVHIGDRAEADVAKPRLRGIGTSLYLNPEMQKHAAAMDRRMRAHLEGDTGPHARALLALALGEEAVAASRVRPLPIEIMALPAVGYALHVMETATRKGADEVYFFTREGGFFREIYDELADRDVFDLGSYPVSKLLEVSRVATFGASLDTFSIDELMRLWSLYSRQSLAALAASLNIDLELWAESANRHEIDPHEVIECPWLDPRVLAFVADPAVFEPTRANLRAQRDALLNYLQVNGFEPGQPTDRVVADIGWRGTIQDNLARIVSGQVHGCYLGLDRFLNEQPAGATKSAFLFDGNRPEDDYRVSEFAALEFLFNTSGGSVTGYADEVAQRRVFETEERLVNGPVRQLQQRILSRVGAVADYVRRHGLISDDLRPVARLLTRSYLNSPDKEAASVFVSYEHNEVFGTGAADDLGQGQPVLPDIGGLEGATLHDTVARHLPESPRWPAAQTAAGPRRAAVARLNLAERLNWPTGPAAPAVLPLLASDRTEIAVMAPEPIRGSGGHRTIYNLAMKLDRLGYDVHLMNERRAGGADQGWQEEVLAGSKVIVHDQWFAGVAPAMAVATIDYSSFHVTEFYKNRSKTLYFIQDYEAAFNPVGDTFLRSERSYAEGHQAFTIGRWLSHVLRVRYGVGAASAGLGVDHDCYRPPEGTREGTDSRGRQIAFLYQPEKQRRAPNLCVEALAEVKRRLPDVEILAYGSENVQHDLSGMRHLGLVTDLEELNAIYQQCAVGLCLSSTNPSRVPFEMMAAGCVPVDLFSYNNLFDYADGTGVLAYQSPKSLAEAICRLLEDTSFRRERQRNCLEYVRPRTLEWETDVAANAVGVTLEGGDLNELPHPFPSYNEEPIVSLACDTPSVRKYLSWNRRLAEMA